MFSYTVAHFLWFALFPYTTLFRSLLSRLVDPSAACAVIRYGEPATVSPEALVAENVILPVPRSSARIRRAHVSTAVTTAPHILPSATNNTVADFLLIVKLAVLKVT